MALSDFSGIIPHEYSQQIIQEVEQSSAVLQLANIMPMGTRITELPVVGALPQAEWVTGTGAPPAGTGRKPYTDLRLAPQVITAEEIAAVVAIPDQYLEDNTINLWSWARPKLAEAIAARLDHTVLFGGAGIPATFPVGGVASNTYSTGVTAAVDAVDAVNIAMGRVESQGLNVTGHSGDTSAKGVFRGVRDENGSLLLGTEQVGQMQRPTLYGAPIAYAPYSAAGYAISEFFTGAWDYLVIGVRQDIRFRIDPSGVILGATTAASVSGFQDNVTPMKVWARFGCTIVRPVTPRVPGGAIPFARIKFSTLTEPTGNEPAWTPPGMDPDDDDQADDLAEPRSTAKAAAKK